MLKHSQQKGFSLIEMIVSLGIFALVSTMAIGALLMMIATNRQLQAEQSVMSNLSFALDSMTREIRTGYAYFCGNVSNKNAPADGGSTRIFDDTGSGKNDHDDLDETVTKDCSSSSSHRLRGISFIESGNSITGTSNRILYFFDNDENKLFRRVGNGTSQSIVSSGLEITSAHFYVTGSESLRASDTNTEQPTVTIYIEARDKDVGSDGKIYKLQTTVTQRTLDI